MMARRREHGMGWDGIAALGSIAGALILLVGAVAAVIQLKQLRLANQMGGYLDLMRQLNSPDMVAAREYVESHDFEDAEVLRKAFADGIDHRVLMIGGYYQIVSRLINFGILDRDLFAPVAMTAPRVWRALRPIAYEMRARSPGNPRWMDIEFLVYNTRQIPLSAKRYSPEFRARVGLDDQLEEWLQQTGEASMPSVK
jgi:hypothetical protein